MLPALLLVLAAAGAAGRAGVRGDVWGWREGGRVGLAWSEGALGRGAGGTGSTLTLCWGTERATRRGCVARKGGTARAAAEVVGGKGASSRLSQPPGAMVLPQPVLLPGLPPPLLLLSSPGCRRCRRTVDRS